MRSKIKKVETTGFLLNQNLDVTFVRRFSAIVFYLPLHKF